MDDKNVLLINKVCILIQKFLISAVYLSKQKVYEFLNYRHLGKKFEKMLIFYFPRPFRRIRTQNNAFYSSIDVIIIFRALKMKKILAC